MNNDEHITCRMPPAISVGQHSTRVPHRASSCAAKFMTFHDSAGGLGQALHELLAHVRWQEGPAASHMPTGIGPHFGSSRRRAAPLHLDLGIVGSETVRGQNIQICAFMGRLGQGKLPIHPKKKHVMTKPIFPDRMFGVQDSPPPTRAGWGGGIMGIIPMSKFSNGWRPPPRPNTGCIRMRFSSR